jgi:hypothetical protein
MPQSDPNMPACKLHPQPPADFEQRSLPTITLDLEWVRIHQTRYDPIYFNRSNNYRFNAPSGEFGVLYTAQTAYGAFLETLGHETGIRVVSAMELEKRSLVTLKPDHPLVLVDFTGAGLARLGADNALCNGPDYTVPQLWSLALWQHSQTIDGIYYRARHDPDQFCGAIFERPNLKFKKTKSQGCYEQDFYPQLAAILDHYQFGLVD